MLVGPGRHSRSVEASARSQDPQRDVDEVLDLVDSIIGGVEPYWLISGCRRSMNASDDAWWFGAGFGMPMLCAAALRSCTRWRPRMAARVLTSRLRRVTTAGSQAPCSGHRTSQRIRGCTSTQTRWTEGAARSRRCGAGSGRRTQAQSRRAPCALEADTGPAPPPQSKNAKSTIFSLSTWMVEVIDWTTNRRRPRSSSDSKMASTNFLSRVNSPTTWRKSVPLW